MGVRRLRDGSPRPNLRSVTLPAAIVRWDDIMDALRLLDREAENYGKPLPHYKRVLAKKNAGLLGVVRFRPRRRDDQGRSLTRR